MIRWLLGWAAVAFLLALLSATPARAQAFVQAQNCSSGSTSCTISITPTTGNQLFVGFCATGGSTLSISDGHNTYNVANAALTGGNGNSTTCETWLGTITSSGALSLVCTSTSSTHQLGCVANEISGLASSPLDKAATGGNTGAVTSWTTSATATTSQAKEIVVSCMGEAIATTTISAGTGFTLPTNGATNGGAAGQAVGCVYEIVTSTGTYSGAETVTTAESYVSQIYTLEAAGATNLFSKIALSGAGH